MAKYDLALYRLMLVFFFAALSLPMLFEIGKTQPAYTFTASTWLVGIVLSAAPAWLGYRIGRAAERARTEETTST